MKKLFLLSLLLSFFLCMNAQRLDNSPNFNFSFHAGKTFGGNIEYEKFFQRNNSYYMNINASSIKKELTGTLDAKLLDIYAGIGYRKYFGNNSIHPFIGGGGIIGYEFLTNESDFPNTLSYNRGNDLIYGLVGDIGAEYNMKSISLFISFLPQYEFKNENFYPNVRIGLKLFIH